MTQINESSQKIADCVGVGDEIAFLSAAAARQIKDLIQGSVRKIEDGSMLVAQSAPSRRPAPVWASVCVCVQGPQWAAARSHAHAAPAR